MNILYVIHQFFPDYKTGTETLARNTAIKIIGYGHEVAFFTGFPTTTDLAENTVFDHYIFEDMQVWRFNQYYKSSEEQPNIVEQEYDNRASEKYFKTVLEEFKPDIIHVFHFQRVTASILNVCRTLGIPVVFTPTDFWFMCPTTQLLLDDGNICDGPDPGCSNCLKHLTTIRSTSGVKKILSRIPDVFFSLPMKISRLVGKDSHSPLALARALSLRSEYLRFNLRLVNKILVPSTVIKSKLGQFLGTDRNFIEMPYGVDFPEKMQHTFSERLRVGFIGTLNTHKGAHILTEAMCSLPKGVCLDAFIYGDLEQFPEYGMKIQQQAEHESRIYLKGTFPVENINEIFSAIDVLVVPSIWHENTPLVAYAAQAYACPVISSRIEGMQGVVSDGINGLFFTPGSVEELSGILKDLSENFLKLKGLSERSVVPISAMDYTKKLCSIYKSLLEGQRQ